MASQSLARAAGDFITCVQVLGTNPGAQLGAAQQVRSRLTALLDQVSKNAGTAEIPPEEIEEARFALVAWADETLLRVDWPGRGDWQREPLQMQLYGITRAGNEFFDHLARLKPEQVHAREIYFLVLALGFEGQYAGQEAERRALLSHQYEMLRAAGRVVEGSAQHPVTPAAYELDIDLPPSGGRGVLLWLGGIAASVVVVYALLWALLWLLGGDVPLPGAA